MSGRSFRSVFMVASCAGAALGCYLVSLRVASERAALETVEASIVLAQRDLRVIETEIGTRGRLAQLERWNAKVLALSAPSADQILGGSFELARLTRPQHQVDFQAPVVLASAPRPKASPIGEPGIDDAGAFTSLQPKSLLHEASLNTETREVPAKPAAIMPQAAGPQIRGTSMEKPAAAAKPVPTRSVDKPGLAAAQPAAKKSVDKRPAAATPPVTKPTRIAKADPLGPLPGKHSGKLPKESVPTQ